MPWQLAFLLACLSQQRDRERTGTEGSAQQRSGNVEAQLDEAARRRLFMLHEHQILRDLRAKSWHNDRFVCCCLAGVKLGPPLPFVKKAKSNK